MNKKKIEEHRTTWGLMAWTLIPIGLILFFFVSNSPSLGFLGTILGTSAVIALLLGILSLVALLSEKHTQNRRKTPKFWIAVLVSLVIAVVVLPIAFVAYNEFYVKPFLASHPAYLRPYVDYQPFFSTCYGAATITTWLVLIFLWGFKGARLLKRRLNEKENLTNTICAVTRALLDNKVETKAFRAMLIKEAGDN